jgi:hypothetical protein
MHDRDDRVLVRAGVSPSPREGAGSIVDTAKSTVESEQSKRATARKALRHTAAEISRRRTAGQPRRINIEEAGR